MSSKAFEEKYAPFKESFKDKLYRMLGIPTIKEYMREIWRFGTGKTGLILFAILLFISIMAAATMPANFTVMWNDPKHWENNPQTVPPTWIKYFGQPVAPHRVIDVSGRRYDLNYEIQKINIGGFITIVKTPVLTFKATYILNDNAFPTGLLIKVYRIKAIDRWEIYHIKSGQRYAMPQVEVIIIRPDGINFTLKRLLPQLTATKNISGKVYAYVTQPLSMIPDVGTITTISNESLAELNTMYGVNITENQISGSKITNFLFGKPVEQYSGKNKTITYVPLKGKYVILVKFKTLPNIPSSYLRDEIGKVEVVVKGSAYGLMGTDNLGRDLAIGLYYGFPIAMAIGVVVAFVDTVIGVVLGVISGYYGGWVDELIQRTVDIIGNIPLLPILILIASIAIAIFHEPVYRLWLIMITLIVFGWGGLTIVIRSMALSIKGEPYIEAAKCLGASNKRIIFLHITPQVIPYAVASMVFSVPGAILAEAGLAVLGIYHGYPTWGLILAGARQYGRIDLWWWIIPPGLLIAITSLTFVLLGMALERIVEPRLRTR